MKATAGWLMIAAALGLGAAQAQPWPARGIEMIVSWPAGGGVDVMARTIANAMSAELGQNIVVANRDGAAGTIGFNVLAGATPDGYTVGGGPTTPITNAPFLVKGARYDVDGFEYICQYWENVFGIAVPKASPFKTAQELFAAAKASPGKLSFGHAGNGSIPHLAQENLAEALGLKFQAVPFRGDAPMLPVLLKGELDFAPTSLASIRGLDLRVLAIYADKRRSDYPDVPTAKELGVPHSVPPGHNGVFTPKGTSAEIRAKLESACEKAVAKPQVRQAADNAGGGVTYLSGPQFRAQTVSDYAFKRELIRRLGLEAK
jgi:tripartite-type tricarboxylate transporter receptor subunit TctC